MNLGLYRQHRAELLCIVHECRDWGGTNLHSSTGRRKRKLKKNITSSYMLLFA